MSSLRASVSFGLLVGLAGASCFHGWRKRRTERLLRAAGLATEGEGLVGPGLRRGGVALGPASRPGIVLSSVALGIVSGAMGIHLAGPPGVAFVGAGALPFAARRRKASRSKEILERQLAEVAEAASLGVRSGLSVPQAIQSAADEVGPPMSAMLRRLSDEQRLGTPFDRALGNFSDALGTEDALLFRLVVSVHSRSGGNLASALEEVTATIRHRIAVRRELRSLSAQGRISGMILGSLPIGFFLVVATTSHRELAPVYRSPAGLAMVTAGFAMEAVAFVWIRQLLRVSI
jgi:Flp pilus assembly protein TadB